MHPPFTVKVYLAGPGVFRPDALAFGTTLKDLCAHRQLEGLWPLDNEVHCGPRRDDKLRSADLIRRANEGLIIACHAVIADISPFRGPHMDPGTAYEIGYAKALRKPVFAWSSDPRELLARMQSAGKAFWGTAANIIDDQRQTIENFGMAENLMIGTGIERLFPNPASAIDACADYLQIIPKVAAR
jgi:nucleoside 2-deoxyribosyltransferase